MERGHRFRETTKHISDKGLVYSEYIKNCYNTVLKNKQHNCKIVKRFEQKIYKYKISIWKDAPHY